MYGHQLIRVYDRLRDMGLTTSREEFSRSWCGNESSYLRCHERHQTVSARVRTRTITRIRMRLTEVATMLPAEIAAEVRAIDQMIADDIRIADLLCRRSVDRVQAVF